MKPPFHLFMDLDGVVLHGWHYNPALRSDWSESIEADIGFPSEHVHRIFIHPDYPLVASGQKDLKQHLSDVFQGLGIQVDPEVFVDYWHGRDTRIEKLNQPLLSVISELKERFSVPVFLVTQQEKYRAGHIKRTLGLERFFDKQFFSCDVGFLKDDPRFFETVQSEIGLTPEKDTLLYFDDTPMYRAAAEQVGWQINDYQGISDFMEHSLIKGFISDRGIAHAPAV